MGRKRKQAGGNLPLTNYERSKKFKAATSETVAAISQYQLGQCALTTQSLLVAGASASWGTGGVPLHVDHAGGHGGGDGATTGGSFAATTVLCSPSGYLYEESALLEYLLRNTKDLKRQKAECFAREQRTTVAVGDSEYRQRLADFTTSQAIVPTTKVEVLDTARALKNVSYWLDTPEVDATAATTAAAVSSQMIRDRPGSPTTDADVRRSDFWRVALQQNRHHQLVCALSDKPVQQMSNVIAYWTTPPSAGGVGTVALESIFDQLTATETTSNDDRNDDDQKKKKKKQETTKKRRRCPLTDERITHVRALVGSQGTSVQRVERPGLGAQ